MPTNDKLSFTELERRLREIRDGPAATLNTPPLFRMANIVGAFAAVFTLVPFVLVHIMPPAGG